MDFIVLAVLVLVFGTQYAVTTWLYRRGLERGWHEGYVCGQVEERERWEGRMLRVYHQHN